MQRREVSWKVDLLLALAVLAISVPFLREWSSQSAPRYLAAAAIVDDHTYELDRYSASLGEDYAVVDDHVYSDKAPYQSLAAVPAYWAYRRLGGDPFPVDRPGEQVGHAADIGMWALTLWSVTLPAMALIVLVRRHVSRWYPNDAVPVALALLFGTVLLPFSSMLFGHMLAALLGFGAWYLLRREEAPPPLALLGAGVLLGLGVGVEYPQVVVAAVIGIYAIALFRWRAAWVALGGALGVLPLLAVNALVFGGPFETAYQGHLAGFEGEGAFGVYNLVAPSPRQLGLALVGDRGLFSLTPIMVIAAVGAIRVIRRKEPARADGIVAFVLLGLFLLISTGIDAYGGSSPGPRYLVPIIPFFAAPLADAWGRYRLLAIVAAVWSVFWMVVASATDPLYQEGGNARADWFSLLLDGRFQHAMQGQAGIVLGVIVAAGCAAGALSLSRAARPEPGENPPARPPPGRAPSQAG